MVAIFQTHFQLHFPEYNVEIPIKISRKIVPNGPNNNIPVLVQKKAWRRPSDNPLSEPMVFSLLTHICAILPKKLKKQ